VAGKVLGKAPLGGYSLAWTLASMPVEKVSAVVGRVTPSILSAVRGDKREVRRYIGLVTEGIATVAFPLAIGLGLMAEDVVMLLFGEKWRMAIVPLQVLALYASVRSVATVIPTVAQMVGLSRPLLKNTLLGAVVLPLGFLAGSRWGAGGIALAWVAIYPLVIFPLYRVVLREVEMNWGEYLRPLWPAASCTAIMAAAVIFLKVLCTGSPLPLWLRSSLVVAGGVLAYVISFVTLHRGRVRLIRSAIAQGMTKTRQV
jgi:PST family polysaccharide transporter